MSNVHEVAHESIQWLNAQPMWLALAAVCALAFLEYVVPPVPGDVVVLAAGVMVMRGEMSAPAMLAAVMVGSTAGALSAYWIGRFATARPTLRKWLFKLMSEQRFERAGARYRKWGRLIIIANRFLPSMRATLIFAAGFFRVSSVDVMVFSALSALLWNSLLLAVGALIGAQLDELIDLVQKYTVVVWAVLALIAVAVVARILYGRSKSKKIEQALP